MVLSNKTLTKPYSVRVRPASRPGAAIAIAAAGDSLPTAAFAVAVDSKSSNFSSSIAGCGGVMGKAKTESLLSCFTSSGDYFAALSADGVVKVWNTVSGKLLAEWRDTDIKAYESYSSIACTLVGKKRRKDNDNGTLVLGLGTSSGDVYAVNVFSSKRMWISKDRHLGGTTALLFSNKGYKLYAAGTDGIVSEFNAESGELLSETRASKKAISALALSFDEKLLAVASSKIRVFSLDSKKEQQRISPNRPVQHIGVTDSGKLIVLSDLGEKQLHTWEWDETEGIGKLRTILSMKSMPIMLQCCSGKEEGVKIILSVSAKGVAYLWNLMSDDDTRLSTIKVKSEKMEVGSEAGHKSSRVPVLAACLHEVHRDHISVCVVYGVPTAPQFSLVDIHIPCGEDICISALDDGTTVGSLGVNLGENGNSELEGDESRKERGARKRRASSPEPGQDGLNSNIMNGIDTQYDMCEPTMGEKLAALNLLEEETRRSTEQEDNSVLKPPSADSVQVLLKQALHADDHALLLDCLYTQDEKVIAKSTSLLNPSDALKLLNSLVSFVQKRGAVLACAIPWLRSLLLQHASSFMSQDSSVLALNSVYQLVESRTSTYETALRLSNSIDRLFVGVSDDRADKEQGVEEPVIFEDFSDEPSDDAMETDEDSQGGVEDPESITDDEFAEMSEVE